MSTYPAIVQSAVTEVSTASGFSFAVNLPTGLTIGNTLFAFVSQSTGSGNSSSLGVPSGWVGVFSTTQKTTRTLNKIAGKDVNGTEGATALFTSDIDSADGYLAIVVEVSGSAISAFEGAFDDSQSQYPNPPSLTLSLGADNNLFLALASHGLSPSTTVPTGYTLIERTANAGGHHKAMAYKQSTNATEDPGGFVTDTFQDAAAYTIGIPPVVPGPSVTVDNATRSPGQDVTGTYANWSIAPTTATLTDAQNNTFTPALTVDSPNETFTVPLTALPAAGVTAAMPFPGAVDLELS